MKLLQKKRIFFLWIILLVIISLFIYQVTKLITPKNISSYKGAIAQACPMASGSPDLLCLQKFIINAISTRGLNYGFELINQLYIDNLWFRPICNEFTATVGGEVYHRIPDFKKLDFAPISAICNYGFYQQYPFELLITSKDIKQAEAFCNYAAEKLNAQVPGVRGECFRGIGRGLPFVDKSLSGDALRMAEYATTKCKTTAPADDEYQNCLSGVFNQVGQEAVNGRFGLSVNKTDPLWLCRKQPNELKTRCFGSMRAPALSLIEGMKLEDAFATLKKIYQDDTLSIAEGLEKPGYEQARKQVGNENYDDAIYSSGFLPSPYREAFLRGFAVGLAKNESPGGQHIAVINFCERVRVLVPSFNLKTNCLFQAFDYLRGFYKPDQFKIACDEAQKKLGISCKM